MISLIRIFCVILKIRMLYARHLLIQKGGRNFPDETADRIVLRLPADHPASGTGDRQILLGSCDPHIGQASFLLYLCRIIGGDRHITREHPVLHTGQIDMGKLQSFCAVQSH